VVEGHTFNACLELQLAPAPHTRQPIVIMNLYWVVIGSMTVTPILPGRKMSWVTTIIAHPHLLTQYGMSLYWMLPAWSSLLHHNCILLEAFSNLTGWTSPRCRVGTQTTPCCTAAQLLHSTSWYTYVGTSLAGDVATRVLLTQTPPEGKAVCLANMNELSVPLLTAQGHLQEATRGNEVVHTGLLAQQVRVYDIHVMHNTRPTPAACWPAAQCKYP